MSDFLFELGVEEVPVSEIPPILEQLNKKLQDLLAEESVEFKYVEAAATNRRFMLYINQINPKANDIEEQLKGPAKKIAFDAQGNPAIALQKFMEFNNVTLEDLKEIESPKGSYMVIERKIEGRPTREILKEILPKLLGGLTFAKTMVWNASRVPFARPIKNILALLDNHVVKFEFAGILSSNKTFGHILLSEDFFPVRSFKDYCELLNKNFVILREDERRKKIVDEITDIEEEFSANIKPDSAMLDDYVYNNEYPVIFHGEFAEKYLELPSEIISTFMIKEKKLLPVYDKKNNLLNIFIGVSNIPDENKYVTRGNERVIQATFEDAKFFWDTDRKDDFIALRENLNNVVFHKGLGTFYEKTDRLFTLVNYLVKHTQEEHLGEPLKKAAMYCKNDLVTRMVREFPSLQGIMGGLYLKEAGADEKVWKAVYGHYEPKGYVKVRLEDLGAGLLSIADKIDNITGFISKDIKISSSKDPYGIRRDANGIIKVITDFNLGFDLDELIHLAAGHFVSDSLAHESIKKTAHELFLSRIENIFKDTLKYRYDVVNAVLNTPAEHLDIYRLFVRCLGVSKVANSDAILHLVALHKRLKNIVKNAERCQVSAENLIEAQEKILFDIFKQTKTKIEAHIAKGDYVEACSQFLEMKPVVDDFFENVHVMADDPALKKNRIGLVQHMDELLSQIADFSLIVETK
ncbi:MAG: glycine--tRNA ligase subunit beta [Acidobacteria bacterium]|jgi:glycyl-tRNA synthetase beta chain|nr:glycine--tRNA ligase subunit beta [Acidobacteriota bacterium]